MDEGWAGEWMDEEEVERLGDWVEERLGETRRWYTHQSESESHSVVSDSLQPQGLYGPWNSPGQNTEVGSLPLLQGIFPTQELNPGLLHCRLILYQLSHKASPHTSMRN